MPLKVGDKAPEFSLPATTGVRISPSDFRGKKNILTVFYALSWTGV